MPVTVKPKQCAVCKREFRPFNTTERVCSVDCASQFAAAKSEKKFKAETRKLKRKFNEKDRSYQLKRAREACHRYILERDKGQPCISCGITTGQMHPGHYKSVGHAPELRFHPWNINVQCAQCNSFKSGNAIEYRIGLVKKIGEANVQYLERAHPPQNLTLEDIKGVAEYYREALKELTTERTEAMV